MTIQSASRSVSSRSLRDLAEDPDREARSREGLAQDHRLGQAHLQADPADLVLEQVAQRFDELEAQVRRQPADVVVGLDLLGGLRFGRGGLDDVRVERALGQEVDPAELGGLLLEDPDELVADDLALLLRVLDAGQPGQEALARVDHDQLHAEVALEGDAEQLRLLLAHQPVVDVDAGQPIADRAMDERRRHRRIHAAGQGADDQPVRADRAGMGVDPLADVRDGRVDEVAGGPGGRDPGDIDDEVAQDVLAARGVDDLRVELDPVQVARARRPGRRTASSPSGRSG